MKEQIFTLTNKYGLDSQEASLFVETASRFTSTLEVSREGDQTVTATGKDVMGLMLLAADRGSSLKIKATGSDEADVIDALGTLIDDWGERGHWETVSRQRKEEAELWRDPNQPCNFSPDNSRSASLKPSGSYLLDPTPAPDPEVKARAAAWAGRLAGLQGPKISMGQLELLVEKFVRRRLQKAAHPDKRTLLLSACASMLDFQTPIDAWIEALRSSGFLRKSRSARERLLKGLLEEDLNKRLAPQGGAPLHSIKAPAKRKPKKPAPKRSKGRARFAMHTDAPSQKTILLDTKSGDTWMLEDLKWVRISRN